ncbi:hypothetical protein [Desulfosporosinus hippei]|uniref:VWA domain-containing protein n=1 Tax=Desulfosporosinus hippei DSM 8344 TaxID=1121419 RepID=A0A1G7V6C4_9FIRM|nr:hypothetical protein [Desulfosporosinus hippei]SDG55435.1 hypothetical protein SAMN05443529_10426 [Desulfosporosinus hippei DSM 8344]
MGHGGWKPADWARYSAKNVAGQSTSAIYASRMMTSEFDPKQVAFRESRDSSEHPNSTPIIIGLDVTGSMSRLLQVVAEKLGVLVQEILDRNPVTDPQIMFNAIGDAPAGDSAPFQVTQFESDIRIAEQLTKLYFEQGGGGNGFESYPLAWYFAARHTKIDSFDKQGRKGFLFTIGDDGYPEKLTQREIQRVFGDIIEAGIPVAEMLAEVNRKYEVFHLCLAQGGSHRDSDLEKWRDLLGERAIRVSDYQRIPEIIVSILEAMRGRPIDSVVNSWDGTTALIVKEALKGLTGITKSKGLIEF